MPNDYYSGSDDQSEDENRDLVLRIKLNEAIKRIKPNNVILNENLKVVRESDEIQKEMVKISIEET